MSSQLNVLVVMSDQQQAATLDPEGPRATPRRDPECADVLRRLTESRWAIAHDTDDFTLTGAQDGTYRYLAVGPGRPLPRGGQ
jgi:hypothetical protein